MNLFQKVAIVAALVVSLIPQTANALQVFNRSNQSVYVVIGSADGSKAPAFKFNLAPGASRIWRGTGPGCGASMSRSCSDYDYTLTFWKDADAYDHQYWSKFGIGAALVGLASAQNGTAGDFLGATYNLVGDELVSSLITSDNYGTTRIPYNGGWSVFYGTNYAIDFGNENISNMPHPRSRDYTYLLVDDKTIKQRNFPHNYEQYISVDCYRRDVNDTATKNNISISAYSGNTFVGEVLLNDGLDDEFPVCNRNAEVAADFSSASAITRFEITTSGDDAFFMNSVKLIKGGRVKNIWFPKVVGVAKGYCLSTDPRDMLLQGRAGKTDGCFPGLEFRLNQKQPVPAAQ